MCLEDDPFSYRVTKDGKVLVSRGGRLVVTVAGARAERLVDQLGDSDVLDQRPAMQPTRMLERHKGISGEISGRPRRSR